MSSCSAADRRRCLMNDERAAAGGDLTRLKLRDHTYYVPTSDGIWMLTPEREVVLTGPSIFQWIDRLAPYLNGRHTLAELTATLPAGHRQMVERIITALTERGAVVEVRPAARPVRPLTAGECQLYAREIDLLGSFCALGEQSFQAFRDSVIMLVGSGRMITETARAALSSGSRELHVAVSAEDLATQRALAECELRANQRDRHQRLILTAGELADTGWLTEQVTGADLVVYAADTPELDQARIIDLACSRAGVAFVAAVNAGDHTWIGPFGPAADAWPRWMSAWRRLSALGGGSTGAGPAQSPEGAALTVTANQLAREAMRLLSGTGTQTAPARMTRIDLRGLRADSHAFLTHPFSLEAASPDRAGLLSATTRLRAGAPLDPQELSRRMTACLEEQLGVLGEVTEPDLDQIPLAVAQVRVSDPVQLLEPGAPLPVVTGFGTALEQARRCAVLRGLAAYGTLMVDPRRLHVRGDARRIATDPVEDLATLRAGHWSGLVWGYNLADGQPFEVPAEAAFPALTGARPSEMPPPGAAADYSWQQAIHRGLIGQCRTLTMAEVDSGSRRYGRITWDEADLDERGRRFLAITSLIAGKRLDVYDVTGSLSVPTLAFCLDGRTVACASGFSFPEALRDGLADVVLSHQVNADDEAGHWPAGVLAIADQQRLPGLTGCPTWSTDLSATTARLARLGLAAVAVPLDHDTEVTSRVLPYLVNVVVARG